MLESRNNDCGQIIARLLGCRCQAFNIVINIVDKMRTVFRCYANNRWCAPWHSTVISAFGNQYLTTLGGATCNRNAVGRGIRSVLLKQCPICMRHCLNKQFCKFDCVGCWAVEAVTCLYLAERCCIHESVAMTQYDWTPSTHEVDIAATINVGDMGTFTRRKILRVTLWER